MNEAPPRYWRTDDPLQGTSTIPPRVCPTHLDIKCLLDKVQRWAEHLVTSICHQGEQTRDLYSLEHCQSVSYLTVLHKAQVQHVPYLNGLKLSWWQSQYNMRSVLSSNYKVEIPRSRTSTHQWPYTLTTARLWYMMMMDTTDMRRLQPTRWSWQQTPGANSIIKLSNIDKE